MRILTASSVGYPVRGGSQITHLTFLRKLGERGHECIYLDHSHTRRRIRRSGVIRDYYRDLEELRAKLAGHRPDVVVAAHDLIHHVVRSSHELGLPCAAYLNSYEYCPPTAAEKRLWRLSWDKPYPHRHERAFALREADRILVNSRFLATRLRRREGYASEVVFPPFDEPVVRRRGMERPEGPYIAGVCGYEHKGAGIFLELARRFPSERFLMVGNVEHRYFETARELPNVRLRPFGPRRGVFGDAKIFLVPSRWAEPFGRVAVEAMGRGIPTLVSRGGGLAEIAGGTDLGVARFRTADAWERRLARIVADPSECARLQAVARQRAGRFLGDRSVDRLEAILRELHGAGSGVGRSRRSGSDEPGLHRRANRGPSFATSPDGGAGPLVELRGSVDATTAFARVNARWLAGLRRRGTLEVVRPEVFAPRAPRVVIHHDYSEDFSAVEPPPEGRLIAVRTWDFGPFPPRWVDRVNETCDALWVHTRYVRRHAVSSGVPPRRIAVIPHGVDPDVFRPDGRAYPLDTKKTFRFLFVGAPVYRKGIDVLLGAYADAFDSDDPVSLVIKGSKRDVFYEGIGYDSEIRERARAPGHPEVLYLDRELAEAEVADLYRACDVGAFPYRAEGFALPILEAMACGLPSLVPDFGASLDYCTKTTSYRVVARRFRLPAMGDFAYNTFGFREELDDVEWCEVDRGALASAMRRVYEQRGSTVSRRGRAGVERVRARFTWDHALALIEREVVRVAGFETPRRFRRARREAERRRKVFDAAKSLYLTRGGGASPTTE